MTITLTNVRYFLDQNHIKTPELNFHSKIKQTTNTFTVLTIPQQPTI